MAGRRMEAVHALEVYIGEKGYVCIRQEDPLGDSADVVALLPQQVPAVCQWLQECAAEVLARGGLSENGTVGSVLSATTQVGRYTRADAQPA